jgi:hypothetical protein
MDTRYEIVIHEHGRAIVGSVPVTDMTALSKSWEQAGFKIMAFSIAERLGAAIAVARDEEGAKKWEADLGINFDGPDWLLSGDTGISSKTIYSVLTGKRSAGGRDGDAPYDPDDFGRCYRLLKRYPHWVEQLPKVAEAWPIWREFVPRWKEMCALYESEAMPDEKGFAKAGSRAPKLYELIQAARKSAA